MSNPVFYAEAADLAALNPGDTYLLGGTEGRHAVTVKRISCGESIDLNDGAGLRLVCTVISAEDGTLGVRVVDRIQDAAPDFEFVLVQALAKGDRDELAIETATELGVDGVVPWQAERSIVRWKMEKASKGPIKWRNVVAAASKQARRSRVPWVSELAGAQDVETLIKESSLALILHEDARHTLPEQLRRWRARKDRDNTTGRILFIVGPEGGISPSEISKFSDAGAQLTLLGPHVLRSSTAGPAAVVLLSHEFGRW